MDIISLSDAPAYDSGRVVAASMLPGPTTGGSIPDRHRAVPSGNDVGGHLGA